MMKFVVYHHKNQFLARYVVECSTLLKKANAAGQVDITSLPQHSSHNQFAELPTAARRLLFFARPDVLICLDDGVRPTYPIFALEVTNHVPAQDHWMQRFNNLVGAAQEHVPGAYILPFSMPGHPKFPSELDHVFFYAYDRVTEIHRTPVFIAEWETLSGLTLKTDAAYPDQPDRNSADIKQTFNFLDRVVESAVHGRPVSDLFRERLIVDLRNRIRKMAYQRTPAIKDFKRLTYNMKSNRPLSNTELSNWLSTKKLTMPAVLPDRLLKRNQNLIFAPQVGGTRNPAKTLRDQLIKRIDKHAGEPYLGQPLAFDYIFCRLGETPYERDVSLIIDLSVLKFADLAKYHKKIWATSPLQYTDISKIKHIPTYTMELKEGAAQLLKNFLRIYAFAADMIVYQDAVIYF